MAYSAIYTRINWVNEIVAKSTPLGAINLNKMDSAIYEIDRRVVNLDSVKAEQSTVLNLVSGFELDEQTGIITITKLNGENILFDLNVEKIPVSFFLSEDGILTMVTEDGTEYTANIGAMIPVFTFESTDTINVTVNGTGNEKTYSFDIKKGSITDSYLQPNYLADIKEESSTASTSASNALESATIAAESAEQAQEEAERAKTYAENASAVTNVEIATKDRAGLIKGGDNTIGEDGELMLTKTTTDTTLTDSYPGGAKINYIEAVDSEQNGIPTPDAPIEIESVEIEEIWTHGKNELPNNATDKTVGGMTFNVNEDGSVTVNGTSTTTVYFAIDGGLFNTQTPIPKWLKRGKEYIISSTPNVIIFLFKADGTYYSYSSQIFTVPDDAIYYGVFVRFNSGVTMTNATFYPMIRKADITDATYEPHTETKITLSNPITLRGMNGVHDILCKQDGVYGVLRNFDSVVLNGSEFWMLLSANSSGRIYTNAVSSKIKRPTDNNTLASWVKCSHYRVSVRNNPTANTLAVEYVGNVVFYDNENAIDATTYKEWLAENPVTIDYQLATPTFEPLPLADQIALHELETFGTVTYLTTDSTLEPIMEVEYGTSKVGGYALKGMNTADANSLKITQLNTLTSEMATQLVAGSEV